MRTLSLPSWIRRACTHSYSPAVGLLADGWTQRRKNELASDQHIGGDGRSNRLLVPVFLPRDGQFSFRFRQKFLNELPSVDIGLDHQRLAAVIRCPQIHESLA